MHSPINAVLMVIDVQKAIDAPYHAADGPRNNPQAESNIARLLAAWRDADRPVIHIRYDFTFAWSAYRPGQPGNDFKDEVAPPRARRSSPNEPTAPSLAPISSVICALPD